MGISPPGSPSIKSAAEVLKNDDDPAFERAQGQAAGDAINKGKNPATQEQVNTAWRGYVAECKQDGHTPDKKAFAAKFPGNKVTTAQIDTAVKGEAVSQELSSAQSLGSNPGQKWTPNT